MVSGGSFLLGGQIKIQEGAFFGVCRLPIVRPFCSALSFDPPLELQVFQLGIGRMSSLHLRMGDPLPYSEVPNRRACSLRFFRFSVHPARNFSCNKQKIPPCSFINLLSKKAGRVELFSNPFRLFRSALLLGTSEYVFKKTKAKKFSI